MKGPSQSTRIRACCCWGVPCSLPICISYVQTRTLFCENTHVLHRFGRLSTRILKTLCLEMHFFECMFSCGWQIRILSKTMTPSPHPSTSCVRPLNPATSHNNNNNNNGGGYMDTWVGGEMVFLSIVSEYLHPDGSPTTRIPDCRPADLNVGGVRHLTPPSLQHLTPQSL